MNKKFLSKVLMLICFSLVFTAAFCFFSNTAQAASMKISYNGKKITYKRIQINTNVDNKSVTKNKKKGILINDTCMVSYIDVFKNGCKATCSYRSKDKQITLKKNNVTIKMWVGKKYAYVNGKKKKLTTVPVRVRYIKGNSYKILVPANFVATNLKYKYNYTKSNGYINLTSPFTIQYDGKTTCYTGSQGNVTYNNNTKKLTSMPTLSIGGGILVPAKEVFQSVMGMKYQYDSNDQTVTITDEKTNTNIVYTLGSSTAYVNGVACTTSIIPYKIKRMDTKKTVICVPASFTAKKLGYYYSWNKADQIVNLHIKSYFNWSKLSESLDSLKYKNELLSIEASYNNTKGVIAVSSTGSSSDIMKQTTVSKSGNTVTVTIPTTYYNLGQNTFDAFGEIVKSFTVTQDENNNTILTFIGFSDLDYAYSVVDGSFTIELMGGEYVGSYGLKIPKPAGVTFNMVSNVDYYSSNKFKIFIQGNYVDFYNNNPVVVSNNVITSVNVALEAGNTAITVSTSQLQGYKIYDKADGFVVSIGSPKSIYKKIVVLDAGHGGTDPGAVGNSTKEKDLNYKMMYTLMQKYFASNTPDIKAYWTRTTDTFITLADRASFASKIGADIFVSLHLNSWTKSSVNGTEVYYSSNNNKSSFSGITSKKMASMFLASLVKTMGTTNRGISSQSYTVVYKNTVPAVLIELGFISGSSDFPKISNATYQEAATKSIYDTIVEIFNTYPTGR